MTSRRPIAVGLGELLWDELPEGKQLGGAPFNFARHCAQLGLDAFPISRVGEDALGDETIALLDTWGIRAEFVSRDPERETGTVRVSLDSDGKPTYDIRSEVAWDHLQANEKLEALVPEIDIVCFGSLAQRNAVSQKAIYGILDRMRPDSLKLFDVNLRQRFYTIESIEASLGRANALKLSDEELPVLRDAFALSGSIADQLIELKGRFDLRLIAYTRGPEGSMLIDDSGIDERRGNPVKRGDTIGAGDSYAATLCVGLMTRLPLSRLNENANRVAAYVCSRKGATPELPAELVASVSLSPNNPLKIL